MWYFTGNLGFVRQQRGKGQTRLKMQKWVEAASVGQSPVAAKAAGH